MSMPDDPRYAQQRYGLAQNMNAGYVSGRGSESPGLEAQNQRWNSLVQQQAGKPAASVLAQVRPSNVASNASAPSMANRMMPDGALLPSTNGTADSTYEGDTQLRLRGVLPL
jgi:hypothetical protein